MRLRRVIRTVAAGPTLGVVVATLAGGMAVKHGLGQQRGASPRQSVPARLPDSNGTLQEVPKSSTPEGEVARTGSEESAWNRRLPVVRELLGAEAEQVRISGDTLSVSPRSLTFRSSAWNITLQHREALARVADLLRAFPATRVVVQGHTDTDGETHSNWALSYHRGIAVREALIALVPGTAARIEVTGYGEWAPAADNASLTGRSRNRRVTLLLIANEERARGEKAGSRGGPDSGGEEDAAGVGSKPEAGEGDSP